MSGPSQDRPFEEPQSGTTPATEGPHPERNVHEDAAGQLPGPAGTPVRRDVGSPGHQPDRATPGTAAPAGPHARPGLTNEDATPGAGTLPDAGERRAGSDVDADASTG